MGKMIKLAFLSTLLFAVSGCDIGYFGFDEDPAVSGGNANLDSLMQRRLVIKGPSTIEAGRCTQLIAELQDVQSEQPVPAPKNTIVQIPQLREEGNFYRDGQCTQPLSTSQGLAPLSPAIRARLRSINNLNSQLRMPQGQPQAVFYVRMTQSGEFLINAFADLIDGFPSRFVVVGGAMQGWRIVALQSDSDQLAGVCQNYALQAIDQWGNVTGSDSDYQFDLTFLSPQDNGSAEFFSQKDCLAPTTTQLGLPKGVQQVYFSARANTAGDSVIKLTERNTPTRGVEFDVEVGAALASRIELSGPTKVSAGQCARYDLRVVDSFGNVVADGQSSSIEVRVSSTLDPKVFRTESHCRANVEGTSLFVETFAPNAPSALGFYLRDPNAQLLVLDSRYLTGSTPPVDVSPATKSVEIESLDPVKVVLSGGPRLLPAGSCSVNPAILSIQDELGNIISLGAQTEVTVSGLGNLELFSDGQCTQKLEKLVLGSSGMLPIFWKSSVAGLSQLRFDHLVAPVLAPALANVSIVPAQISKLYIVDANNDQSAEVVAGGKRLIRVYLGDDSGNRANTPLAAALPFQLSGAPTDFLSLDEACLVPINGNTQIEAGEVQRTLWICPKNLGLDVGLAQKQVRLRATSVGAQLASGNEFALTLKAGNVAKGLLDPSAPQEKLVDECFSYSVKLTDQFENQISSSSVSRIFGLTEPLLGTGRFFPNAQCSGTGQLPLFLPVTTNSITFSFRSSQPGEFQLRLTDVNASPISFVPNVVDAKVVSPTPPSLFAIAPTQARAGDCVSVVAQVRDSGGSAAPLPAESEPAQIQLSATGGNFFSNSLCSGSPLSGPDSRVVIEPNQSQSNVLYYQATVVSNENTVSLEDKSVVPSLLAYDHKIEIIAGPANSFRVTLEGEEPVMAGKTRKLTVEFLDRYGHLTTMEGYDLNLAPIENLFTYPDCETAISSPVTGSGSTLELCFKGAEQGDVNIQVSDNQGGLPAANRSISVVPGDSFRLAFANDSVTQVSRGFCQPYRVELLDGSGNATTDPLNKSKRGFSITATGSGAFYSSQATCQAKQSPILNSIVPSAQSEKTIYYRNDLEEGGLVFSLASVNVNGGDDSKASLQPGELSNISVSNVPASLALTETNLGSSVGVLSCIELRVSVLDGLGDELSEHEKLEVVLTLSQPVGLFFEQNPCLNSGAQSVSTIEIQDGQSAKTFFFRGTSLGTANIRVASGTIQAANSKDFEVVAGTPSKLTVSGSGALEAGTCHGPFTVSLRDKDNFLTDATEDIAFGLSIDGEVVAGYSNAGCTTALPVLSASSSSAVFYTIISDVGTKVIQVAEAEDNIELDPGSVQVNVLPGPPSSISVVLAEPNRSTSQFDCVALHLTVHDAFGNTTALRENSTFGLSLEPSEGKIYDDGNCSGEAESEISMGVGQSTKTFYYRSDFIVRETVFFNHSSLAGTSIAIDVNRFVPPFSVSEQCSVVSVPKSVLEQKTIINDRAGLETMTSGGYYELGSDIDLGDSPWNPLGEVQNIILDGKGHSISNLEILPGGQGGGLFLGLKNTYIFNLQIETVSIQGGSSVSVGALAAVSSGRNCLDRISILGGTLAGQAKVGALLGELSHSPDMPGPTVLDSIKGDIRVEGPLTASPNHFGFGGIIGVLSIENQTPSSRAFVGLFGLSNTGEVVAQQGLDAAGLIGRVSISTNIDKPDTLAVVQMEKSFSTADVSGSGILGGIIGQVDSLDTGDSRVVELSRVSSTGDIECEANCSHVGGLIGSMEKASVRNCFATGAVSGGQNSAGLIAELAQQSLVENCYATGRVSQSVLASGLVGQSHNSAEVIASYWDLTNSRIVTSAAGIGVRTSRMLETENFEPEWDFGSSEPIWKECDGAYPQLTGFTCSPAIAVNRFSEIEFLCEALPREQYSETINVFRAPGCPWGEGDNLDERQSFNQARAFIDRTLDVGGLLCGLSEFSTRQQQARYDDTINVNLNGVVLFDTSHIQAGLHPTDNVFSFPEFEWLSVRGTNLFVGNKYFLPGVSGNFPGHDVPGVFDVSFSTPELVQQIVSVGEENVGLESYTLSFILFGDNDPSDCGITSVDFFLSGTYVVPTVGLPASP